MNKLFTLFWTLGLFLLFTKASVGQMTVTNGETAEDLAAVLTGEGVNVYNAELTGCEINQRGTFKFPAGTSDLGIDSGIVLTTGAVIATGTGYGQAGVNDPYSSFASHDNGNPGDPDLTVLAGVPTNDACILEFDFVPSGDTVKFNYVFGSDEYPNFACSSVNDVFGFFISGGDYSVPTNIALVPGTSIPVSINSVNHGPPDPFGDCSGMGPGSPFTEYYIDNNIDILSPYVVYGGFTTIFTAIANVNPCDTFHLKIAIADGGDHVYDSGVFLEAGSLSSTALDVHTYGGAGFEYPFTNCVRGCPPGKFTVSRSGNTGEAIEVEYTLEGTAVNGVDYETLPGSVIIPAGEETVDVWIEPLILDAPVGPKTVIVNLYSPYMCPGDEPLILSTDTITILDSMFVDITQGDTAICIGQSVDLHVEKDALTDLTWTPIGAVIPDPTALDITVSPTATITYVATVEINLEGVACPPASDQVTIEVKYPPDVSFEGDYMMCLDGELMLDPIIDPAPDEDFTYNWTPADGLSSTTIRNPLASPGMTTTYTVEVNPGVEFCSTFDSVRVTVLPNDIELLNNDTVVCAGTVLPLNAAGHTAFSYYWSPDAHIDNPHAMNTAITATESGYITVTASHDGCEDMPHSFYLEVQPVPEVDLGPDKTICSGDTLHLYVGTTPEYEGYTYDWSPGWKLTDSTAKDPVFNGYSSETFEVIVSTPIGCTDRDTINIIVNPSNFATVNVGDTALCPVVNLQLEAYGAEHYRWEPSEGLSNDTISNPFATPAHTTNYILYATSDLGCVDTKHVNITVYPEAVTYLPDSVHIWPGESYEIELESNAHYFDWFPPEGLSSTTIPNPIASPDVRTRYFVTATTEGGCNTIDSIDIIVHTESVLDVPNAFVPGNSFADNGILKIVRRGDATLKRFEIFNRWGNKVFSTTDIHEGWDGTMDGKPQPMGVYVYQIEAVLNNGKVVQLSGNVTLIR